MGERSKRDTETERVDMYVLYVSSTKSFARQNRRCEGKKKRHSIFRHSEVPRSLGVSGIFTLMFVKSFM